MSDCNDWRALEKLAQQKEGKKKGAANLRRVVMALVVAPNNPRTVRNRMKRMMNVWMTMIPAKAEDNRVQGGVRASGPSFFFLKKLYLSVSERYFLYLRETEYDTSIFINSILEFFPLSSKERGFKNMWLFSFFIKGEDSDEE